jgi:hypothetical protein
VPPSPADTLDLSSYAGFDFVSSDGRTLEVEVTSYSERGRYTAPTSFSVRWLASTSENVAPPEISVRHALALRKFPLDPGVYGSDAKTVSLIVLNQDVAVVDLTIDGTVHRARLMGERDTGYKGAVLTPGKTRSRSDQSFAEQFADERGVLATVTAGGYDGSISMVVDVRGKRTKVDFGDEDRVA